MLSFTSFVLIEVNYSQTYQSVGMPASLEQNLVARIVENVYDL